MAEQIIFDASEVAPAGRTELDLTPWISNDGIDWGDAALVASMSEQAVGSGVADYRIPNRSIRIPLSIRDAGGTTFATARALIQSKIGLWQQQGGWIKRVVSGGTVFCDVVTAQLHLGGDWMQNHSDVDTVAAITLEAIPDFYEAEETLADHTETTLPEITFTETTVNGGDFPLGDRVRVVVDDDSAQNQRGLIWAFRGRHYSAASTAASAYEAEALTTLDTATRVAKVGASGGTVITHGTLSTNWTPVVGTNLQAGSYLTHTGTNRLYARVFSTSGTAVQARAVWDVGDLVLPSENDAVRLYDGGTFHILDLGEIRLDPPPTGAHRWQGQIQAKGDAGAESFSVDRVWMVNQDETAGVLTAPPSLVLGAATYSARSEFSTESGAITGDSLRVGGTWAGAGDADDFQVAAGVATRTAVSDAGPQAHDGRIAVVSGLTLGNCAARIDCKSSDPSTGSFASLILRYVDTSNYLRVAYVHDSFGSASFFIQTRVAGSMLILAIQDLAFLGPDAWGTLIASVDTTGGVYAQFGGITLTASSSALASGGALDDGSVGFADTHDDAGAATRTYDNFAAWVPTPDAVAFASQSVELSTQGITREDSTGAAYGPVSIQTGDIPRMPNRSSAGTVEFVGKLSRGDLATVNDPGIDDISARVHRRASHLLLPG